MSAEGKITFEDIALIVNTAGDIATTFAPQFAAFIVLGKAVATLAPELYDDIVKLFSKQDYTAEEVLELSERIAALKNPASIV
jgi:hypothetical protein